MTEARVTEVKELPSADPARMGKMDKWIWYEVPYTTRPGRVTQDPEHPGKMMRTEGVRSEFVILAADKATPADIGAAIKAKEAERAKLTAIRVKL